MKTKKHGLFLASSLALLAGQACEAQVGEEYQGESLLSLRGNVLLDESYADTELEPALAFYSEGGLRIVRGQVTGEFPSKFRFDVASPPPDSTFFPKDEDDEIDGELALGFLVMLPPDHADLVPALETEYDSDCNEDFTACTEYQVACSPSGQCRQRTLDCSTVECDVISSSGDPELARELGEGYGSCVGDTCHAFSANCNEDGDCYTVTHECDRSSHDKFDTVGNDGTMQLCELVEESGDTSLVDYADIDTVAVNYQVVYLTEANEIPEVGSLKPGYNLIEATVLTRDEWNERVTCRIQTRLAVVEQYNQEHGTSNPPYWPDDAVEELVEARQDADCSPLTQYRVVDDALDAPLTIELGSSSEPL